MSKFLSLEWFKGKVEHSIDKVVTSKLEHLMNEEEGQTNAEALSPFKNVMLVNDALTIVMSDGSIMTKSDATEEDYQAVLTATSVADLIQLVSDPEVVSERIEKEAEAKRMKALIKGISILEESGEFTVEGTTVYFKGLSRSLPQLLVEQLIEVVSNAQENNVALENCDEYVSLKRFFMWCCLNPRAEVAHELYRFLKENSFRITKQGFFVALRNVVTLHGSPELVHFISNSYNKVKAVWKKSPDDYTVFLENGVYKIVHESNLCETKTELIEEEWDDFEECYVECEPYETSYETPINHGKNIGKLTDLYLDLPNRHENRFTDDWTKTFDIRIGKVVNMPKEDCSWSTQDCAAAGLHFTSDQIHYVGCGDQSVLVLINPMKVVGIGKHKGRCYEYLPIMTVSREEATKILHDSQFDTLQLDENYAIRELESLEQKVQEGFVAESSKYEFNLPQISMSEIRNIAKSLDSMKAEISSRVVLVD
tara:strand:- start:7008 stop:8450 length:1443 start_codon:yes stop_codon:yes gene_type:complete